MWLKCSMNGGRFCQAQASILPFFCLDYDANVATSKQRNNCNERHDALPYKSLERYRTFLDDCWAERSASACYHRYLNYTQSIVCTFQKVMRERPHAPLFEHWLKLLFMWQRSCRETISHIRMLKLIERDAGDKEREQRQLFVTSLHLTGIIRYMKLKFHSGGSCWQHGFLFRSLPPFFPFVLLFMLIWCVCVLFLIAKKRQHSHSQTAWWFHFQKKK